MSLELIEALIPAVFLIAGVRFLFSTLRRMGG